MFTVSTSRMGLPISGYEKVKQGHFGFSSRMSLTPCKHQSLGYPVQTDH
jgi:hypothetical protein